MPYDIPKQDIGAMPNQITGTLNGEPFYFRARHGGWALMLKPFSDAHEVLEHGEDDQAGWWSPEEAQAFCESFLKRHAT